MKAGNIVIIFFTVLLSGCIFDSDSSVIIGDYKTGWIDIPQTRDISKGRVLVPAYVSAIGHNKKYIIARQHPIKEGAIVKVHSDTTNYYIIEISACNHQDKPVYGPLDAVEFDRLRRKFGMEDIRFDMKYPE